MDLITLAMAKKYTDSQRIGYTERKELASFQLTPNADIGMNIGVSMGAIGLEVGKTYTVTTDSGSYTAVCKEMSGTLLLGNANFMMDALDNTGETFCVVEMDDGAGLMTVAMDANNGTHMKVSAETIVPIDPKYLPGVCLPVVELSEEFIKPTEMSPIPEKILEVLKYAYEMGTPVVLRTHDVDGYYTAVASCELDVEHERPAFRWNNFAGMNMAFFFLGSGEWMYQIIEVNE